MFLQLKHQKLDVYTITRSFVIENYKITKQFPSDERFCITQQIRRAALSVYFNLAEGCSRKSVQERNRYFEVSRGSIIEIDAVFDIAVDLGYCSKEDLVDLSNFGARSFSMICKMIKK